MCLTSSELDLLEDVIYHLTNDERQPNSLHREHIDMLKALWSRETGSTWEEHPEE